MKRRPEGIGIGFRMDMAEELLERAPESVGWLELHPENYIRRGGRYRSRLAEARERWPLVTHGLTMSFGCTRPHEREYMDDLRDFLRDVASPWHSDHACFGGAHGSHVHDLLPVPFTDEAVSTMQARVREAQDQLDVEIAVENVSYYAAQAEDPLLEIDFLLEVLEGSDAKLMLDVNNVYVNSQNFGFDPKIWIDKVPVERVVQMHVAGHYVRQDGLRIDTHGEAICDGVYELLDYTLRRVGPVPVLLERDNNIPPLDVVLAEVEQLSAIYDSATSGTTTAQSVERA
ncbi:MAG: DUF692 domain-containing protein [Deltaproteobacteria bacterium]|nr:DUF692 domain-containing protein [Deltaproteobacteria bacterium]